MEKIGGRVTQPDATKENHRAGDNDENVRRRENEEPNFTTGSQVTARTLGHEPGTSRLTEIFVAIFETGSYRTSVSSPILMSWIDAGLLSIEILVLSS